MKKLILFLILSLIPLGLFAQQSVFQYIDGEVTIKRASGSLSDAQIGDTIVPGDSVITGADGYAELTMENSSLITIDKNTSFLYSSREKKGEKKNIFMVVLGKIKFKFDRLLQEPDIETPSTVAGVRGTEFTVVSALDGSTMYVVDQGSVAVEAQGSEVVLVSQEGVKVPIGDKPGNKFEVKVGSEDFSNWLDDGKKRFITDPSGTVNKLTEKLKSYIDEVNKYYLLYKDTKANLDLEYKNLDKVGKEKGDDEKIKYNEKNVRPLEILATDSALNYRYYGLSALSVRRFVISEMYVSMKTRYIMDKGNKEYTDFLEAYNNFLKLYESEIPKVLVEADI